ncbi:MAG TPA: hypothetical protein VIJ60_04915, partial [Acidimicrobiales bacterium]
MHLALAEQFKLARFLVLDIGERGVLLAELRQRDAEPHFVLPILSDDGDRLGGGRAGYAERCLRRLFAFAEAIASDEAFKAGEGDGVALLGA